jgi:sirohydrochlorin cobaltochelatase
MHKLLLFWMIVAILGIWSVVPSNAGQKETKPEKKAILLVAFGTSVPEAQSAYKKIEEATSSAFPGMEIRWAYTSRIIRAKLAKQGVALDSPEMALARLMGEEVTQVGVLSLHVIPGIEFHDLHTNAVAFARMAGGIEQLSVARPLLSSREDMVEAVQVLLKHIPSSRKPEDLVLFMGHGSEHHPSDAIYAAMNCLFQELDPQVFLATVDGYPAFDDILPKLLRNPSRKVYLMPFMAVAGDHARNDMAGDQPESWKMRLKEKSFSCEVNLTGMAEYPGIIEIWLKHLNAVFP